MNKFGLTPLVCLLANKWSLVGLYSLLGVPAAPVANPVSIEVLHGHAVSVDLTTQSDGGQNFLAHDLLSFVLRNVDLEEASVGLGQRLFAHVPTNIHSMLVAKPLQVRGQSRATPHEL